MIHSEQFVGDRVKQTANRIEKRLTARNTSEWPPLMFLGYFGTSLKSLLKTYDLTEQNTASN